MERWKIIPEIVGCNARLRLATWQASQAVEHGRNFLIEGESGSGRRLLAHNAWYRRAPGARPLFTLDCANLHGDCAELLLFGQHSRDGSRIQLGRFSLVRGGAIVLLNAESLPPKTQQRIAGFLEKNLHCAREEAVLIMMTSAPASELPRGLAPELAEMFLRLRIPPLRERIEDIRALAEAFLRQTAPFERIRCSPALIDRFCAYDWPGNIAELQSVLLRLMVEQHHGILDVRHLAAQMHGNRACLAMMRGTLPPEAPGIHPGFLQLGILGENRSLQ